ncbi:MAG TPA: TetR/AcrR family transcriptional regulator [Acidimicrobiales bacterium]
MTATPELTARSGRAADIVAAARIILEKEGADALTMRRLAADVGIQAPSLYKHFPTKRAVETAIIAEVLLEVGEILHAAVAAPGRAGPVRSLLDAYHDAAKANPAMYRLATSGRFPREDLPPGLEDWAGRPFFIATGEPWKAQALFSFAHGMVILELDERFPPGSDLGRTWKAGAAAFTSRS